LNVRVTNHVGNVGHCTVKSAVDWTCRVDRNHTCSRILVENLFGKLMSGKVSGRWVKNVTVDFSKTVGAWNW